jgi:hypothetical protein
LGIDYYSCDVCGKAFPDVCSYSVCEDCGSHLCGSCRDEYGVGHSLACSETIEKIDWEFKDEYDLCPFCSDDIITDEALLAFAIEMLDTTKEKLIEEYLKDV